jgi:biotin operon repressor
MHYCKFPDKSKQMTAILKALRGGKPRSTLELAQASGSCCVATRISELRQAGYDIHNAICIDKRYFYRMGA